MSKSKAKAEDLQADGIEVRDRTDLEAKFADLAEAQYAITKAEVTRDLVKSKADEDCAKATEEPRRMKAKIEPPVREFCIEHRDELLPEGKKSAIIGPVTIEFRLGPAMIETLRGQGIESWKLIQLLQTAAGEARGEKKKSLEGCLQTKITVKLAAVKDLPEELLKRLKIRLTQREEFRWKPNAER